MTVPALPSLRLAIATQHGSWAGKKVFDVCYISNNEMLNEWRWECDYLMRYATLTLIFYTKVVYILVCNYEAHYLFYKNFNG